MVGHLNPRVWIVSQDVSQKTVSAEVQPSTMRSSRHLILPEGEATRLELERQLSELLAAKTERDQRIARLTDELALKSTLLEQAEANAVEAASAAAEHANDRRTSLVKQIQREAELVDMQAKLLSRDQQIGQYRAKLKANESELEAVRLRLTYAEKGLTKSKAEADTLRAQTATGSVNRDEFRRLMERMQVIEAEMASKQRA